MTAAWNSEWTEQTDTRTNIHHPTHLHHVLSSPQHAILMSPSSVDRYRVSTDTGHVTPSLDVTSRDPLVWSLDFDQLGLPWQTKCVYLASCWLFTFKELSGCISCNTISLPFSLHLGFIIHVCSANVTECFLMNGKLNLLFSCSC